MRAQVGNGEVRVEFISESDFLIVLTESRPVRVEVAGMVFNLYAAGEYQHTVPGWRDFPCGFMVD